MAQATQDSATQDLRPEIPLSLKTGLQFKFHVLIECNEWRSSTLGHGPLQFITKTQGIIDNNGADFVHPLAKKIWDIASKCTTLGGGDMTTVDVPINNATGQFDWKTPDATRKKANLWVRVFEVDSARIAEEAEIKAQIDTVKRTYAYWTRMKSAIWSDLEVLDSCSLLWGQVINTVDKEVIQAKEKYADALVTWMKPKTSNDS